MGASLSLATQVSSHETTRMSARELYWGEEILPDHVLYPAMMAIDRFQIEKAEPTERIYMEIVYAGRRLVYGQELLKKDKSDLAVTTLTKSQKYLLQAGKETLAHHTQNRELVAYVLKAYTFHQRELERVRPQISDPEFSPLVPLLEESAFVFDQLLKIYKAN